MSARDDYQRLAAAISPDGPDLGIQKDAVLALDEIDRLRGEVAKLRQDVGTLEVRGWEQRVTPAERELIDAALAVVVWSEGSGVAYIVAWKRFLLAADGVRAERGAS